MKKLLVTLGPSSLNPETIKEISKYNPYVFRLNMSHVALNDLEKFIKLIRQSTDVPICIDSEGAQIRTHKLKDETLCLEQDHEVELVSQFEVGTKEKISLTPKHIVEQLKIGDIITVDWHGVSLRVVSTDNGKITAKVKEGGIISSCKAVTVVNRNMSLEAITPKDKEALGIGQEMNVKHFALSFADTAESINEFRNFAPKDAIIISKIESLSALKNLKTILTATDEALIDRGDLSRVVPIYKVPFLQMRIISIANILETPIFVATNLLESMVLSKLPTRAELNDIVSSILMGANGLVLAVETAAGGNPIQSAKIIKTMLDLCNKWTPNASIQDILDMNI